MQQVKWNVDEIEKTARTLRAAELNGGKLDEPVAMVSAAQFRSMAGLLRGGSAPVIVTYRKRPVCLAIPHPVHFWQGSRPFVSRLVGGRNRFLVPPYCEPTHTWASETTKIETGTMEQLRRQSAQVFGHILRNTVFVVTYYDQYEAMCLVPVPPGMPEPIIQYLSRVASAFLRLPAEAHAEALREPGLQARLIDFIEAEESA